MSSKYKFYSQFVVEYAANILKLQTKEDGILPIIKGLIITMTTFVWWGIIGQAIDWVPVVFLLVGTGIMLWGLQIYFTTWTFNRYSNLVVYRRPGFPEKKYTLDKIIEVHLDSRKRRQFEEYRIVLEMPNSEWVPLSRYGRFDPQIEAQVAIREFLGMEEG